jgi:hypothetical protein
MDKNDKKKSEKIRAKYECKLCDYTTCDKKDYGKHLLTLKHINGNNDIKNDNDKSEIQNKEFICECGKTYLYPSGLSRHKKKCFNSQNDENNTQYNHTKDDTIIEIVKQNHEMKEMFMELLKENKELKELMIEQNKHTLTIATKGGSNITNNTTNNTKFNMQFFLNEKCKDAINLMDFVNDLQIKMTDLENVGRLGYCEGISKIFINGLKELDVSKRPIHCSDVKREVLYVKDQDTWEKENEENKKITNAIKHISHKNIQQIPKWTAQHPYYKDSDSKQNDQYLQILCESMGSTEQSNIEKIISNVAKEVVIDKK